MKKYVKLMTLFIILLGAVIFTACSQSKTLTISFDANDGREINYLTIKKGEVLLEPLSPIKDGHEFVGWYTDNATFNNKYTFNTKPNKNVKLYAKWDTFYTITFDSNGGSAIPPIIKKSGENISSPWPPAKENCEFKGWYTDNETFNNRYTFTAMPSEDTTLYALWDIFYIIYFDTHSDSTTKSISAKADENITAPAPPQRSGYTFEGWYTDNGTFLNEYVFSVMPAENITLNAKWTVIPGTAGLSYKAINNYTEYEVTGLGSATATGIVIPAEYNGIPVTRIGEKAFDNRDELTSVAILGNVSHIGKEAFLSCNRLISVSIPNTVKVIGEMAFLGCTSLTSITIPWSVDSIGMHAFYQCSKLSSIYIERVSPPDLGHAAFDYTSNYRKIYVPYKSVPYYKSASEWSRYSSYIFER